MQDPKNFIISTSRMWNCGDDFIAYGCRNVIDRITGTRNNYIAYNRNPDLHLQRSKFNSLPVKMGNQEGSIDLKPFISKTNWVYDNSWRPRNGVDDFDGVVFAGTPEWYGQMVRPMVDQLKSSKTPVYYLGVGGYEGREQFSFDNLPEEDRAVLKKAKLVTVRDQQAQKMLKPVNPHWIPCPALFSYDTTEIAEPKNRAGRKLKIALTTQPDESVQPTLNKGTYQYTMETFKAIIDSNKYDCEVLCHYVDEIIPLKSLGIPVRYTYDAKEYFDLFKEYDLLITTRVHGAGAASSLGIPSMVFKHSARSSTVDGFLSEGISLDNDKPASIVARIEAFDLDQKTLEIQQHKQATFEKYQSLLSPLL